MTREKPPGAKEREKRRERDSRREAYYGGKIERGRRPRNGSRQTGRGRGEQLKMGDPACWVIYSRHGVGGIKWPWKKVLCFLAGSRLLTGGGNRRKRSKLKANHKKASLYELGREGP